MECFMFEIHVSPHFFSASEKLFSAKITSTCYICMLLNWVSFEGTGTQHAFHIATHIYCKNSFIKLVNGLFFWHYECACVCTNVNT